MYICNGHTHILVERKVNISVVVPLFNEEESLPELHAWIVRVMNAHSFTYEVIFIDDGSKDASWKIIESLCAQDSSVYGIKFQRNYGKSAALQVGFEKATGEVVVTMDARRFRCGFRLEEKTL
jgi:glycosyltransferase involved in cell wall biosynthesis